ncbi:MAG TPA: ATP-binding protein, partial [Pirellulaceae bacterium]|nr:ATP-binding protein [Pirellulaceae bacterium]
AASPIAIVAEDAAADASRIVSRRERPARPLLGLQSDSLLGAAARNDLEVLYRTAQAVSRTLDIDQLCERLLELIFQAIPADRGCLLLNDPESGELAVRAVRHRRGTDGDRIAISRTILDYVTQHGEGVRTRDARADERWDSGASIVREGIREAICVPMLGRYGNVGAIYVDTRARSTDLPAADGGCRFRDEQLELMVAIGHQAALAVEDTSYYSALVQSERLAAMGQTVATLSHHIKNILQGLRGGGFLIEEGIRQKDDEAIAKGWKMVERNQERIQQLVLDMLTFSKERTPELHPADLDALVDETIELMARTAADQQVRFERFRSGRLPPIPIDSEGIHRAVLNLITNAIDACAAKGGGVVRVETRWDSAPAQAEISVSDDGVGIAEEDLERIFRPFESSKGNRGTGLGLPATRKIVREHGGDVTVESRIDVGSRFVIRLPGPRPTDTDEPEAGPEPTITFGI